jgi:UDP-N-acetylglucosamine 2-epimerase (non-hydrolysing)
MRNIFLALRELAERFKDEVHIVFPMHLNPKVSGLARDMLSGLGSVVLLPPLDYVTFVHLMKRAHLILKDSGGVQEEVPSLGKPVLVMRAVTERPEGIAAGTAMLVGVERERIVDAATMLLTGQAAYKRMANAVNPYGDGQASRRIVDALLRYESGAGTER